MPTDQDGRDQRAQSDNFLFSVHHSRWIVFNYNDIPAGYYYHVMKSGPIIQQTWHRLEFQNIIDRLSSEDKNVLDLGCGPGTLLALLAEQKKDVRAVGVDLASIQIDFAKENIEGLYPDGRVSFVGLAPSASFKLPMKDQSFDVVIMTQVVEHIHPFAAGEMLREVKRVLKKDGKIIVSTPNYRSHWPLLEAILEKVSPVKYHDQHINKFTPSSFIKFLETCGFECYSLSSILVVAPFLAHLGKKVSWFFYRLEKRFDIGFGSLIVAECKIWNEPAAKE